MAVHADDCLYNETEKDEDCTCGISDGEDEPMFPYDDIDNDEVEDEDED